MSQSPAEFNEDHTPVGYLITFRSFGTWLHGDRRGSVDRFHKTFGTPTLPTNVKRTQYERRLLSQRAVRLDGKRRAAVERRVVETCEIRKWILWAFNIPTNHVHSVVTANQKPELVRSALKANATRHMRKAGCWVSDRSPWARRGSRKYLWTENDLLDAIAYVKYDQGERLPNW